MKELSIDLETYSDIDIKKCGVYKYAESEHFEILLFAVSIDNGPVHVYDLACGDMLPMEIIEALTDETVTKWAFNATFERVCLSWWLKRNYPEHFYSYSIPEDTVNNYLDPGGVFLFDFNTPAEYSREERISYADECGGVYLIGRNDYEEEERINYHTVTFFVPEDDAGAAYSRFEETHVQRAYSIAEMKAALEEAGMRFISAEDEQGNAADEMTRRCLMTAGERGKTEDPPAGR